MKQRHPALRCSQLAGAADWTVATPGSMGESGGLESPIGPSCRAKSVAKGVECFPLDMEFVAKRQDEQARSLGKARMTSGKDSVVCLKAQWHSSLASQALATNHGLPFWHRPRSPQSTVVGSGPRRSEELIVTMCRATSVSSA